MANVAYSYGTSCSTIGTIHKNKNRIFEHVKVTMPMQPTVISLKKGKVMEEIEKFFSMWIEHQTQNSAPVSLVLLQGKVKSLFEHIKAKRGSTSDDEIFSASIGGLIDPNMLSSSSCCHN